MPKRVANTRYLRDDTKALFFVLIKKTAELATVPLIQRIVETKLLAIDIKV
jgi:hypothetical protein